MHSIYYTETLAITIRREILRIFLAIAIMLRMTLLQIDVIDAYIESFFGQKDQPICMKIPQGCENGRERLVCKILKSPSGLKQAGRLWNKTIIKFIKLCK